MTIFERLPTVDSCCFCINLKWGSILIVLFTLINFGTTSSSMYYSPCRGKNDGFQNVLNILAFVVFAAKIFVVLTSLIFLYGIVKSIPKTATWYMYGVAASMLADVSYFILAVFVTFLNSSCKDYVNIFVPLLSILLWVYFLIVVKSYRQEM